MFGFYLRLIVYLSLISMTAGAGQWESRPGTLDLCEGEDAELGWHYLEDGSTRAEMIFWMEMNDGDTMIAWYADNNSTKVYPDYAGRVFLLPGTNAGIVLRDVTEADGRQYNIEVAGPGLRDAAYVNVYTDERLVPILQVDNAAIDVTSRLNKSDAQQSTITVSTRENMNADITIETEGTILAECPQVTVCSSVLSFSDFTEANLTTTVLVDYGVCQPHTMNFVIYTGQESVVVPKPKKSSSSTAVVLILIIIIILAIIALIGLWFILRKKQLKKKPLTGWQKTYVKLPCFYKLFTQMKKWKSVSDVVADPEKLVEDEPLVGDDDHYDRPKIDKADEDQVVVMNEGPSDSVAKNETFFDKVENFFSTNKNRGQSPRANDNVFVILSKDGTGEEKTNEEINISKQTIEEDSVSPTISDQQAQPQTSEKDLVKDEVHKQKHAETKKKPTQEEREKRQIELKKFKLKKKKEDEKVKHESQDPDETSNLSVTGTMTDEKPSDGSSVDPPGGDIHTDDPKTPMTSSDPMQRHESSKSPATDIKGQRDMAYRSNRDQDSDDNDKESVHDSEISDEEERKTKDYVGALKDKETDKLVDLFSTIGT